MAFGARSRPPGFAARFRAPGLTPAAQHLHGPAARVLAAATGEPGHAAELLQHLLHLHELLQQTIHFLNRGPAALRDALAPAAVDDVLLPPFVRRHRADDGLGPRHLLGIYSRRLSAALSGPRHHVAHARNHPEEILEGPHLANRAQLVAKILERELVAPDLRFEPFGVFDVNRGLGLLDERQHVAHAEHA